MVDCWLPYGETEVYVSVELENLLEIADYKQVEPEKTANEIISDALIEPSGKSLEELLVPGVDVAIASPSVGVAFMAANKLEGRTIEWKRF